MSNEQLQNLRFCFRTCAESATQTTTCTRTNHLFFIYFKTQLSDSVNSDENNYRISVFDFMRHSSTDIPLNSTDLEGCSESCDWSEYFVWLNETKVLGKHQTHGTIRVLHSVKLLQNLHDDWVGRIMKRLSDVKEVCFLHVINGNAGTAARKFN